jgi:hypothetical protein
VKQNEFGCLLPFSTIFQLYGESSDLLVEKTVVSEEITNLP